MTARGVVCVLRPLDKRFDKLTTQLGTAHAQDRRKRQEE